MSSAVPQHPLHRTSRERGTLGDSDHSRPPSPSGAHPGPHVASNYDQAHSYSNQHLSAIPPPLASPIPTPSSSSAEAPLAPAPGSLDANLRQLALLQALVARQQALVESTAALHGHPATIPVSSCLPQEDFTPAPPSSFGRSSLGSEWSSVINGLNHASSSSVGDSAQKTSEASGLASISIAGGDWAMSSVTANELASAQQQLDLWSRTVFHTDSPSRSQAPTPAATPSSPLPHPHEQLKNLQGAPFDTSFDWASLYSPSSTQPDTFPNLPSSSDAFSSLPSVNTNHLHRTSLPTAPFLASNEFSDFPPSSVNSRRGSTAVSRNCSGSASATAAGSTIATRGGGRRGTSRAIKYVEQDEELDFGENDPGPLQHGTPEEIEEDKRRRNTAASARFRAKKKQRDAALQQTSVQLRDRVQDLERQKTSLKAENQWLKGLISERSKINPKVRELLSAQSG